MTDAERAAERAQAALRGAPASGGVRVFPVSGTIDVVRAQEIFAAAMRAVMEEWFARGCVEGRLCERERLATLLNSKAALRRREAAGALALSDKPAAEAIDELEAMPRGIE